MTSIVKAIDSILINLISNEANKKGLSLLQKLRFFLFRRGLAKEINQYIITHDGSILTSGRFERYLNQYHIVQRILTHVSGCDESVSEEHFIKSLLQLFDESGITPGGKTLEAKAEVADFLYFLYGRIEFYYTSQLNLNERIILSKTLAAHKEILEIIEESSEHIVTELTRLKDNNSNNLSELTSLLKSEFIISDPSLIQEIYEILSSQVWQGKIHDVQVIAKLLYSKNTRLAFAAQYLLDLLTVDISSVNFKRLDEFTTNEKIHMDLIRKTVFVCMFLKREDLLPQINCSYPEINQIIEALIRSDTSVFFDEVVDENIFLTYRLKNSFPSEQWLVNRIILNSVIQRSVIYSEQVVTNLLGSSMGILDRVFLYECRFMNMQQVLNENLDNKKRFFSELSTAQKDYIQAGPKIRSKFYAILLNVALSISIVEANDVRNGLPRDIRNEKEIELLCTEVDIQNNNISYQQVLSICLKYDEFWPINNFLISMVSVDKSQVIDILSNNMFLLSKSIGIFFIYLNLLDETNEEVRQLQLLNDYESIYGDYLDYWMFRNCISKLSSDCLTYLYQKLKSFELHCYTRKSLDDFIAVLLTHNKNCEVIEIVERYEKMGITIPVYYKYKGIALLNQKKEIEAIESLKMAFLKLEEDDDVIYYLLICLINNKRTIPRDVFEAAKRSNQPSILMVAAIYAEQTGAHGEAMNLITKALLRSDSDNVEIFGRYIGLHLQENEKEIRTIKYSEEDTVVIMKNINTSVQFTICIYKENVLPEEPYYWNNAIHIYTETAIQKNLFKKIKGDVVIWDGEEYVIEDIQPVDFFLFQVSTKKLIDKGEAKQIIIPSDKDGNLLVDDFLDQMKEMIGPSGDKVPWFEQYKLMTSLPLPLAFSNKFEKVTYMQLVNALIEDDRVIFRNQILSSSQCTQKTVLTFAAVIALYRVGFRPSNSKMNVVPESLNKHFIDDTTQIVKENSRDIVASFFVIDEKACIIESSEEEKKRQMQLAIELKQYCKGFDVITSNQDLMVPAWDKINLKELLGVVDYDALAIAQKAGISLVTTEAAVSAVANECGVSAISIPDFLAHETDDIFTLLEYVKQMLIYCFSLPITDYVLDRIVAEYDNSDCEKREKIVEEWATILERPLDKKDYKHYLSNEFQDLLKKRVNQNDVNMHPIYHWLAFYSLRYKGLRFQITIDANGQIRTELISDGT